jgi:ribosome-associated protein
MFEKLKHPSAKELAMFCAQIIEERKAEDVIVIKVGDVSLVADYFVICTGTSHPHLKALAEWIRRKAREQYNVRPIAIDGSEGSDWVVIDFSTVMVHIFSVEARERYKLEQLWGDAEKIEKLIAKKVKKQ